MRGLEALLALGAAAGLHALVFAGVSGGGDTAGAGDRGNETLSLHAAPPGLAEMIEKWETPPEVLLSAALRPPAKPEHTGTMPDLPQDKAALFSPCTCPSRRHLIRNRPPPTPPASAQAPSLPDAPATLADVPDTRQTTPSPCPSGI